MFEDAVALIPEGHSLILFGSDGQWRARILPPGYVNEWSPQQPVEAKARTPAEAVRWAVEKCSTKV